VVGFCWVVGWLRVGGLVVRDAQSAGTRLWVNQRQVAWSVVWLLLGFDSLIGSSAWQWLGPGSAKCDPCTVRCDSTRNWMGVTFRPRQQQGRALGGGGIPELSLRIVFVAGMAKCANRTPCAYIIAGLWGCKLQVAACCCTALRGSCTWHAFMSAWPAEHCFC
jgi:hypothetical protein